MNQTTRNPMNENLDNNPPSEQAETENLPQESLQELLMQIPDEQLIEVLAKKVQQNPKPEAIRISRAIHREFSGPMPPGELLEDYEKIQKGFANRLIQFTEKEQEHRHQIENKGLHAAINAEMRGQKYALLICLVFVLCSYQLIMSGYEISGSILGGGTLLGLATVFITGRKSQDK